MRPGPVRAVAAAAAAAAASGLALAACGGGAQRTGSAVEPPPASDGPASTGPGRTGPPASAESSASSAGPQALRPGAPEVVAEGLDVPWGLGFLPDGTALVTERDSGRLLRLPPDRSALVEVGSLDVDRGGEGGLLGLAVSPTFADDGFVHLYRSRADGNEVVRFAYDPGAPDGGLADVRPVVTGIPHSSIHNGGRVAFGPDGMLYVSTGDSSEGGLAQDVDSLAGKVLRVRPDGTVPDDNPFPGSPVWTLGHRNVQGLSWDADGVLYATEFGQNTYDEVNRLTPGGNYGWPVVEGAGGDGDFVDPLLTWSPSEASPSGAAVAGDALYVAALRGERLWRVPLTGDGSVAAPEPLLRGELGRLRTVQLGPDGALWLATSNGDGTGGAGGDPDVLVRLPLTPA